MKPSADRSWAEAPLDRLEFLTLSRPALLFRAHGVSERPQDVADPRAGYELSGAELDRLREEYLATEQLLFDLLRKPPAASAPGSGRGRSVPSFYRFDAREPSPAATSVPPSGEFLDLDTYLMQMRVGLARSAMSTSPGK